MVVGDGVVRVREAGDLDGWPVVHFHGTPGSRLELAWADDTAAAEGVRIVTFDRPGYGGSSARPFGLASVAAMALSLADVLGLERFATMGQSGGGPFALATAAAGGSRVTAVGVASGAGPFQHVPDALGGLSDIDQRAVALLVDDPVAAAETFASGFTPLDGFPDVDAVRRAFEPALSQRDKQLLETPEFAQALLSEIREGLRSGTIGGGWDNVAWVGAWDVDVSTVSCPVFLWYGLEDRMAPPAHGRWLHEHLPTSTLVERPGEGHFGLVEHYGEALRTLKGS